MYLQPHISAIARCGAGGPCARTLKSTGFATKAAVFVSIWLVLVALAVAEVGSAPSSAVGWSLLIVLGPGAYILASTVGDIAVHWLSRVATRLELGRAGRILLLLAVLFPVLLALVYFAHR